MDEVAGVRETYNDWATRTGMITDGGLGEQRGAAPPKAKEAVKAEPPPRELPEPYAGSRTMADAEDWARRAGFADVRLGRNLNAANALNYGVDKIRQRGLSLPEKLNVQIDRKSFRGKKADRVPAQYAYTAGYVDRIYINAQYDWASMGETAKRQNELGWWSTADPHHPIIHELGHAIHAAQTPREYLQNYALTPDEAEIAVRVSRYAATSRAEFIAETFTGHIIGRSYDDEVLNMYRKWGGPETGQ